MKIYKEVEAGLRIQCDCDDEQCYRAIEMGVSGDLTVYEDSSDVRSDYTIVELPEQYLLIELVEVEPLVAKDAPNIHEMYESIILDLKQRCTYYSTQMSEMINKKHEEGVKLTRVERDLQIEKEKTITLLRELRTLKAQANGHG